MTGRFAWKAIVVLAAIATLISACGDMSERPLLVRNEYPQKVVLKVFGSLGLPVRVATEVEPILRATVELEVGDKASVLIAGVQGQPRYTLAVEVDGREVLRRTFERGELDKREWHIVITEQGIQ